MRWRDIAKFAEAMTLLVFVNVNLNIICPLFIAANKHIADYIHFSGIAQSK